MSIQDFIDEQLELGITLNRLARLLGVSYPTMKAHNDGDAEKVNFKLAKSIYDLFGVVIDPYIELELKS